MRWKESVTRFTARDMGLGAVATHGHTGTRAGAHPGKVEATFIQEDKDASAEWGGAQFYESTTLRLSYAILVHPKFGFNEGELGERIGIEWQLDRVVSRQPILMQGCASCSQLRSSPTPADFADSNLW